jgi:glycosyltransferase involved in cell wall biosynthesis
LKQAPQNCVSGEASAEVFPPVSVILCARNERDNLSQYLISLLTQDYPVYEVIVVNDCSEDDTEELLSVWKQKYPHLRSTIIKRDASFLNSRKFAATIGIKAASYEWLLFTEPGYYPASNQWIKSMSRHFGEGTDIVLGYSGYTDQKGFPANWIKYDACFNAMRYFGFAMAGIPYTGTTGNLAYRKSLFYAHNGFALHAHILSGDDLLVNQAANGRNTAVNFSSEAHTCSVSENSLRGWIRKKCEYFNARTHYKSFHSFLLFLEPFSRTLFLCTFVLLLLRMPDFRQYFLGLFLLRTFIFFIVTALSAKKFNIRGILSCSVLFDLVMPFVYAYAFFLNKFLSNRNKWK